MAVTVLPLVAPSKGRSKQRHQSRARMHHPGGMARSKDQGVVRQGSDFSPIKGVSFNDHDFFVATTESANESLKLDEAPKDVAVDAEKGATPLQGRDAATTGPSSRDWSVLTILGTAPVAFHRPLVEVTGSVTAALWLSNAISLVCAEPDVIQDQFELSREECYRLTGLTRREQETARLKLRELGIISERRTRSRIVFTLNHLTLTQLIYKTAKDSWKDLHNGRLASQQDTGTHG